MQKTKFNSVVVKLLSCLVFVHPM